jgi:hypothetical protein
MIPEVNGQRIAQAFHSNTIILLKVRAEKAAI